jgi:hypothetical protein
MIGGSDKVLWVDENAPAADLILRVVRQHWPSLVFQDADEDQPLDAAKSTALAQPTAREFFLYSTAEAAQEWLQSGATDNNKNTLIHVIVGNRRKPDLGLRSVTLVGDDWAGKLAAVLADIQAAFEGFTKKGPPNGQVAPLGPLPQASERE